MATARKAVYVADFETANNPDLNVDETWVWLAVAVDVDTEEPVCVANSIEGFVGWLLSTPGCTVYFHNLSFDGNFLLSYLVTHGWRPADGRKRRRTFDAVCERGNRITYITLRDETKGKVTLWRIYDSYRIAPLSEEELAEKFELTHVKGSIDYTAVRERDYRATQEEVDYCINDCRIICEVIRYFRDNGWLEGFTIGMIAVKEFRKTCPNWRGYFPILDETEDAFVRQAYRGGIAYVNKRFKGEDIEEGCVYDANSLYPSQMLSKPMPYGPGEPFEGEPHVDPSLNRKLWVGRFTCTFRVKPGHIPMLQLKHNTFFPDRAFIESSMAPQTITMTSVDFQTFSESYDIWDLQWEGGYYYNSRVGFFTDFIEKFRKLKEESTGAVRQIAKLILNNLYGKFATNPMRETRTPYLTSSGRLQWTTEGIEYSDPLYIPVGAFITSYGHQELCRVAAANWERFLYCDTDSVHLTGREVPVRVPIDDSKLCYWKRESDFTRARYLGAKCYIEDTVQKDGSVKLEAKIAGLPYDARQNVTWDSFHIGTVYEGKLERKVVRGGVILRPTTYEIKER